MSTDEWASLISVTGFVLLVLLTVFYIGLSVRNGFAGIYAWRNIIANASVIMLFGEVATINRLPGPPFHAFGFTTAAVITAAAVCVQLLMTIILTVALRSTPVEAKV